LEDKMKLKIFILALIAFPAISQTTYQSSKYKPVWYSSTYEKTHGTYALFDTSSIKLSFTNLGKPELKMIGPTANTLFYVDSTGTIQTGTVASALLKTAFDDSLNNAHTVTGAWKFSGNVGAIPAGQVSIGKNASNGYIKLTASGGDTFSLTVNTSAVNMVASGNINLSSAGTSLTWTGTLLGSGDDARTIGGTNFRFKKGFYSDSLYVGGKGQTATIKWGQMRQLTDTDSSGVLTMSSGNPVIKLQATDADNSQITVNTSDQMLFQNASGGYVFDADLTYGFIHFVGSADSVAVTPTVAQYLYTKLLPGIVTHEADGVTFDADSLTVLTAGDYACFISVTLSGTNANDYWRIKVFKNNAALPNTGANSVGRFIFRTTANNQTDTREFVWYFKSLAINDVLSWRITNLSAARNPTVTDMKLYFYKIPE
jgi:hypothetical protein